MQPDNNPIDADSLETQEWIDALEAVIKEEGAERAHYILDQLIDKARRTLDMTLDVVRREGLTYTSGH